MPTRRDLLRTAAFSGLAVPALGTTLAGAQWPTSRPGFLRAKDIAEAGFIFGFPIVMNYGVMHEFSVDTSSPQFKATFNQIHNEARVFTWQDTAVVTPNSDTPYSNVWMDLRAEPIVISVPSVDPNRYYSVQLCDGNTYNFGYVGTRATGSDAGNYMVASPHWAGTRPEGIKKVFRSSTQFALALFRTQLFDAGDIDNVKKVQAGYRARPLSAYLNQPAPPPAPAIDFPRIDKELVKRDFFAFLDFALRFAPPRAEEAWIREQLARIGVGPGKTFEFKDLSLEDKAEILLGMAEGQRKVEETAKNLGKDINGWQVGAPFGDAAHYHGDWLSRAAAAQAGIYGNDAIEAMYPAARVDADGQTLNGSKHAYTLTFPAGQFPPAKAFWSATMYDGKTQLLIKNPIDRYLINSPMLPILKRNGDGSLTIYIQSKSPGVDKESNWLPAPEGPMYIAMRLYLPRTEAPSILPAGEGTWQPPGIKRL
jgi:hypothetical protein